MVMESQNSDSMNQTMSVFSSASRQFFTVGKQRRNETTGSSEEYVGQGLRGGRERIRGEIQT